MHLSLVKNTERRRALCITYLYAVVSGVQDQQGQKKENSKDIENIFMVLKELLEKENKATPRNKIGFKQYD